MSTRLRSALPSVVRVSFSSGRPTARAKATGVSGDFRLLQKRKGVGDLRRPRLRSRIVERDHKVAGGGGGEPALDDRPGLEIIGEREDAEVMAQRSAEASRRRLHRRHARRYSDVERAKARVRLDRFEHRRRHREYARIAARDDRHRPSLRGQGQGETRAIELHAIVACVSALVGMKREPLDIGPVADDVRRALDLGAGLGRHPARVARPKSHNGDASAHGRRPRPGTRIIEK